jgi:hypothetical protein
VDGRQLRPGIGQYWWREARHAVSHRRRRGMTGVASVFFSARASFTDAKDAVAATGAMTGVIGTMVTAFPASTPPSSAGADITQKVAAASADAARTVAGLGQQGTDRVAVAQADARDKANALAAYIDRPSADEVI